MLECAPSRPGGWIGWKVSGWSYGVDLLMCFAGLLIELSWSRLQLLPVRFCSRTITGSYRSKPLLENQAGRMLWPRTP